MDRNPNKGFRGGGVGEETLLQKGPSPTKQIKYNLLYSVLP